MTSTSSHADNIIAYQGVPGAYSQLACRTRFPDMDTLPLASFEDMLQAVVDGDARYAMVPVENSLAGRVADIHHLLPSSGLSIIGEHFQPVHHHLLGVKGATLDQLKSVKSHAQGLAQCRNGLRKLGLVPEMHPDTAGAASDVAAMGDASIGAIASSLAAEIYGLDILKAGMEDASTNTTRMLIMAKNPEYPANQSDTAITTLIFRLRSVPAALYKALGGFATNGINLTKLESYMLDGNFTAVQFYIDAETHVESP
ncbi:MAG: prephenate dehydratase, partial [Alphaproteobacteria bacterium]|nr:prephenate dehydratase [Alphaproteobacteria bacterium]